MRFFRHTLGTIFLTIACPVFAVLLWYTGAFLDGSFKLLLMLFQKHGFFSTTYQIWAPVFLGSKVAWTSIIVFALFELALLKMVPGKIIKGPETPNHYIPKYKDNGLLSLLITIFTYVTLSFGLHLFSPTLIYFHFGEIIGALCLGSFLFCILLYAKGKFFPSGPDTLFTGNIAFDFFWGTELYPKICGWDVKQFTSCRFGMMSWPILLISYCSAQSELYGLSNSLILSTTLQIIYVIKFFYWEAGYLRSIDIMHDKAGFYICWGTLVWVPSVYTSTSFYLVHHPIQLSTTLLLGLFLLGSLFIATNYLADRQRMLFREHGENVKIWKNSPDFTVATYITNSGQEKENLLLASGFWGLARHFHYIPEILAAFSWSLPALFSHFFPYFYVVFLTALLFDRANRDDKRCREKYGDAWAEHCSKVPYKILPYIY
jgi:7-dehydrocholesterol reductase